jgi:hypothetical protein
MLNLNLSRFVFAAAMTVGAGALVAGRALAAVQYDCMIVDISADTNATHLTVRCANDSHAYTAGYGTGCPAANTEQIKLWHSQAMAALLAGKRSTMWYTDCASSTQRGLSGLQILAN